MCVICFLFLVLSAFAQEPNLTLRSPAFDDNQSIPSKYTCDGNNVNPPLVIRNVPANAKSMVLVVHDPDAPAGDWNHWAVYDIKPETRIIIENSIPGSEVLNDFNKFHYGGPCPPDGKAHHYVFELYALDNQLSLNPNGSLGGLLQIMQGHVLDKTRIVGIYKK